MKKPRSATIVVIAFISAAVWTLSAQSTIDTSASLPAPYQIVENWPRMPPGRSLGNIVGIDIDADGKSLWVFERCGGISCSTSSVSPIVKFNQTGAVAATFGAGMFTFTHGVHVDRDGNVWVTDAPESKPEDAGKGQVVVKFSPDGKVLMTLGKAGVKGDGPDTFNRPSDVITAPNGDIFVADGHGEDSNARIVKFSKDGKFIKTWGKKGTAPGEFDAPHALAFDSQGRLFVGDRENRRIQIFDQDGRFILEWRQFGRPSGIAIDKNDILYVTDADSSEKTNPGWAKGVRVGSARDGKLIAFIPDDREAGGSAEAIAVDAAGDVFLGESRRHGVVKYVHR